MNIFSWIRTLFFGVDKSLQVLEDGIDVANANMKKWKAETMKDLKDELGDTSMDEVNDFYDSLYRQSNRKRK